ncbi:MAG: hypothetical protein A2664_04495 [Candidatus Taylorbacteria bacterium RIFCSPHIGHO2_01_FULL_46_22b]|uniref:Tetratricopeptide repeat-like domain-containing protein n=1 Tax=Candidatus Taylorbacteria bacterium RIFCSPHIGHO2_01_FULL_46_22b TaxID=1802301 RepID=A0A1G2M4D5_9BACT|nr:MAG: hypothetical protein A2664_04495 [Candidatus Taylorbacteria bacterium RIFCSPHIGHO2_01_FULL_46_22b]
MENETKITEENKNKKPLVIGITLFLLALGGLGWYVLNQESFFRGPVDDGEGNNATTTVNIGGVEFVIPPGGKVDVEEVPIEALGPAPVLERTIAFPKDYPEEAKSFFNNKLKDLNTALKKNPRSVELWIEVGLTWQMISDYTGAQEAWEYALTLSPNNYIILGNLGFLNGFYLKNFTSAETYFKRALVVSPQLYLYEQLFSFYRDALQNPTKARALAEEGKKKTGNTTFFNQLLGTL